MPLHATLALTSRLTAKLRLMDPLIMNTNESFLSGVTGLTGGGATNLDGVDTTRINKPYLAKVRFIRSDGNKELGFFVARTAAGEVESVGNPEDLKYIYPDNYHATTNNVVWERTL